MDRKKILSLFIKMEYILENNFWKSCEERGGHGGEINAKEEKKRAGRERKKALTEPKNK